MQQQPSFTDQLLRGEISSAARPQRNLRLISGGNSISLDPKGVSYTVADIRGKMKDVLNLQERADEIVLVNGQKIDDPKTYVLNGTEDVEFIRRAGQKG